jgi:Glycosyl transferase family 2
MRSWVAALNWLRLEFAHTRMRVRLLNRIRRRARIDRPLPSRVGGRALPEHFAVLGIVKNESHLIDEWLEHYLDQGADRIFLIDNGSTDDTPAKIERWRHTGRVELVSYPEQHQQQRHYWNAFRHFAINERCEWLAIADVDEFWFCKSGETLASYLHRDTAHDALFVHWTNFGSSGHETQPASVRESLIQHDPRLGPLPKCIFRTHLPQRENDIEVHFIRNAALKRARVADRHLQLNHYVAQSRDFWLKVKMTRGDVFYSVQDLNALADRFQQVNAASTATCTRLRDLLLSGFHDRHAAAARRQGMKSSTIAVSPSNVQKL